MRVRGGRQPPLPAAAGRDLAAGVRGRRHLAAGTAQHPQPVRHVPAHDGRRLPRQDGLRPATTNPNPNPDPDPNPNPNPNPNYPNSNQVFDPRHHSLVCITSNGRPSNKGCTSNGTVAAALTFRLVPDQTSGKGGAAGGYAGFAELELCAVMRRFQVRCILTQTLALTLALALALTLTLTLALTLTLTRCGASALGS